MEKLLEEELDFEDRERIADMKCLGNCLIYFKWFAKKKT